MGGVPTTTAGARTRDDDNVTKSKRGKKVKIQTPPPTKKEKEKAEEEEEKGENFFDIPVHIIPPGAQFRPRVRKKKAKTTPKLPGSLEKAKGKAPAKVQPTGPRQHEQTQSEADDPSTSAHCEEETLPVSNGFTIPSCPCCKDRNHENLRQMAERGYALPVPRKHPTPVPYSLINPLQDRSSEIHLLLKITPVQKNDGVDERSASVLKGIAQADVSYELAMKKLATSVDKF